MSSPPSERTATIPDNNSEVEKHESQDSEASNVDPPFVDGGVRGWSTVAGSWCLLFSTLGHLIYSIGFADAVRVSGYISLGGLVAGNLLVRTPTKKIAFREAPPTFLSFLKDPAFVFFVAGTVISFLGFYFPIIYLQLFAVEKSIDTKMAFYSIAILNGSGVVGRIVANHMADVFGLFNIQVPCTFITAALIWLVLAIKNVASLVTVSALYGLFSGAWLSLCMVATAVLSKSPSEVGARTGMTMGAVGVSVLFSAPIQGAVLGKDDMWIRSVAVSASFMLIGAVLTLVAGVLMHKGKRGP
ncbi:hypothetical protein PM082_018960 [Marasmius tenuissimus]|nr:hypothetical protein PM082_018960 [Marasmius tenuissimus]